MSIGTFIGIVIAFFVGYFLKEIEGEEKKIKIKNNEELEQQKERYKRTKKAFNELMDYDYDNALGGGKNE